MMQESRKTGGGLLMNEKKRLIEATCPECRGPLSEVQYDRIVELRCLVEHAYSPKSLLEAHSETKNGRSGRQSFHWKNQKGSLKRFPKSFRRRLQSGCASRRK